MTMTCPAAAAGRVMEDLPLPSSFLPSFFHLFSPALIRVTGETGEMEIHYPFSQREEHANSSKESGMKLHRKGTPTGTC